MRILSFAFVLPVTLLSVWIPALPSAFLSNGKADATSLRKKQAAVQQSVPEKQPGAPAPGKSAEQLVQEANAALERKDLPAASTLLDEARAANPQQEGLWQAYATLSLAKHEILAAIDDLKKELTLYPANVSAYPMLVGVYLTNGQRTEAEETLAQWSKAAPQSPAPARELVSLQIEDGHAEQAVVLAKAALARTPQGSSPDEELQFQLGRAQLRAGQQQAGDQTLVALLKATRNASTMNNVAYELGDAGLELPLAESTAAKSVETIEGLSQSWTLDEDLSQLRAQTRLIEAAWDTLGWINFREGKTVSAESYISAAWHGYQSVEVARHLGELALARGDKRAALHFFTLAQQLEPTADAAGAHTGVTPEQAALAKRLDELRRAVPAKQAESAAALQSLRTVPLGPGPNGTAQYKMLVNALGVIRAEPVGEHQLPGVLDRLERTRLTAFFPKDSPAHLVLTGSVTCHAGRCELVLDP